MKKPARAKVARRPLAKVLIACLATLFLLTYLWLFTSLHSTWSGHQVSSDHDLLTCNKQYCQRDNIKYWRYNSMAPREIRGRLLGLPAIPVDHRFPAQQVFNVTAYSKLIAQHAGTRSNVQHTMLFAYNPSIVSLPSLLPLDAAYLVAFRVSKQNYCFHPDDRKRFTLLENKSLPTNMLGLALLNADLTTLDSIVLDILYAGFTAVEDVRLFALHNQLYLTTFDQITPLYLFKSAPSATDRRVLSVIFQQSSLDWHAAVRLTAACAPCEKTRGSCGKNFNYFAANTQQQQQAFVEIWPSHPHQVRQVNLQQACQRTDKPVSFINESATDLVPSFLTIDQVILPSTTIHDRILTRGRGSACCIDNVKHPHTGEALLIGIAHTKTPSQGRQTTNITANHYLSYIYAMQKSPPFTPLLAAHKSVRTTH
jgi:hypothetical protein